MENKSNSLKWITNLKTLKQQHAALKLITQDKVHAMIGPATSGNMLATVQIANQNKIPVVTGSGTAQNVTENEDGTINEYVFRTCFIDPFQGIVAANFATEMGTKNVAIYADNSSDYAKGLAASFKQQIEANGGTVIIEEAYVAKDVDFKSTLTRIKSANPDFIFIPGYYEEVGLIVKQARELGIDAPLMGGDGWDSPTLVELAGAKALNNTFISNAITHHKIQMKQSKTSLKHLKGKMVKHLTDSMHLDMTQFTSLKMQLNVQVLQMGKQLKML